MKGRGDFRTRSTVKERKQNRHWYSVTDPELGCLPTLSHSILQPFELYIWAIVKIRKSERETWGLCSREVTKLE